MFNVNRNWYKFVLLDIITLGIYGLVVMGHVGREINTISTPRDGRHTMHFLPVILLYAIPSLGIVPLVWFHRISDRIGTELRERGFYYKFGASDFWLWGILGSLIIVGPFIYLHKLLKAMNLLNRNFLTSISYTDSAMVVKRVSSIKTSDISVPIANFIESAKQSNLSASIWLNVLVLYTIVTFFIG